MIYRISLEDIRKQIEDVLILDKWKMTKNEEQIKYLTEKRHYRKGNCGSKCILETVVMIESKKLNCVNCANKIKNKNNIDN